MPEEHSNATGGAPDAPDPIIAAIAAYRAGMAAYDGSKVESDEEVAHTYGPPLAALIAWSEPALSEESALEALRLAVAEMEMGLIGLPTSLVRAALAFFEEAA